MVIADLVAATTAGQTVSLTSGNTEVFATMPVSVTQSGGANTIISSAGSMTVSASAGSQVTFNSVGGDLVNEAPTSEFVAAAASATSTINAAADGADTIFAGGGLVYNGSTGGNSVLVAGAGAVSVASALHEVVFAGMAAAYLRRGATASCCSAAAIRTLSPAAPPAQRSGATSTRN